MAIIETQGLTKRYGSRVGVSDLNISVPEGAIYGFLGPNGSGKTTTIRVLMGFMKATEGRAAMFGLDCWRETARIKADVGYLPGDLRLYSWLNARTAIRILGAARRRDLQIVGQELVDRFELDPDIPVRRMSRGMRQKLGIILALVHEPRLLILDEPTASLDPIIQRRLYEHLLKARANGRTVLLSSHTLSEVEELCGRVAILRRGRLVAENSIENLQKDASRAVTIKWSSREASEVQPPSFLELGDRRDATWNCRLRGPAGDLIEWMATQDVADVTIQEPDLNEIFYQYYRDDA